MAQAESTAVKAWETFSAELGDELLAAVAGAFAMVACADGKLTEDEVDRFVLLVSKSPRLSAKLDMATLESHFRQTCEAILQDFEAGFARAKQAVAQVAGDVDNQKLVIGAAQIAIVADDELAEVEEIALRNVCEALGVDPTGY